MKKIHPYPDIGNRLKEIRGGMKRAEMAQKLDIPLIAYQRYERGERKPPFEVLQKAAKIGQVSLDWMVAGEDISSYLEEAKRLDEKWSKDPVLKPVYPLLKRLLNELIVDMDAAITPSRLRDFHENTDLFICYMLLRNIFKENNKTKINLVKTLLLSLTSEKTN